MNPTSLLSQLTVYLKYSLWQNGRQETWEEIVERNKNMHLKNYELILKTNSSLRHAIEEAYKYVKEYKILPSMRSMQFGGEPILRKHQRIYNCCYMPIDDIFAFRELFYLLLCGCGVGYSVQKHHVERLPLINKPLEEEEFFIEDSIEGWADAVHALFSSFMEKKSLPLFRGDNIRKQGTMIHGIQRLAPGPDKLLESLATAKNLLLTAAERSPSLRPIDVMDLINILSEAVIAGGVRRSAMICLFSADDDAMLEAKTGEWWTSTPWRCRSNNSAVMERDDETAFRVMWHKLETGGSGEPGVYFTNDKDWGTNPCVETALRPYQFCNLTEINASTIVDQEDFNKRTELATLLGTLQAGYTDFTYLRPIWKKTTAEDALLGVSITGIAHGTLTFLNLKEAARCAVNANKCYARMLGINSASRITCVKPSGTTSLVLGCSSGIHGVHSQYYIRHIRIGKDEPIYNYLKKAIPELIEDEIGRPNNAVIKIPQCVSLPHASYRTETALDFLDRVRRFNEEWVGEGHVKGINKHNVSATVSIRPEEWKHVGDWLWENRHSYTGMACLPYFGGHYKQAPFEECTQEVYEDLLQYFTQLNILEVDLPQEELYKDVDNEEPACAGGLCLVQS